MPRESRCRGQSFDFLLLALGSTGRYSITGHHVNPAVGDYPAGSDCDDFAEPAEGWSVPATPAYADVLSSWVSLGTPASWDSDDDGRPCEDAYPEEAFVVEFNSELQP